MSVKLGIKSRNVLICDAGCTRIWCVWTVFLIFLTFPNVCLLLAKHTVKMLCGTMVYHSCLGGRYLSLGTIGIPWYFVPCAECWWIICMVCLVRVQDFRLDWWQFGSAEFVDCEDEIFLEDILRLLIFMSCFRELWKCVSIYPDQVSHKRRITPDYFGSSNRQIQQQRLTHSL